MLPAGIIKKLRKPISLGLTFVLVFYSLSQFTRLGQVKAVGTFTNAKLTISDSRADATSVQYDFSMVTTEARAIKQVDIYFCTTPTGACTAPADLDTGTPTLSANDITGTGESAAKISAQDNTIRVSVGTEASQSGTLTMSFTGLTNTSDDNSSFYARVTTYDPASAQIDTATVASAVLTNTSIAITASVESTFSFTVTEVTTGSVNGASIDVTGTSANSIPFGVLTSDTPKIAAHDLTVVTNADNGYQVTVKALATPPLSDGTNNIDTFTGTNAIPVPWSGPTSTTENDNTGFFGYTTTDTTLSGTQDRFDGNEWAGTTTTADEVSYSGTAPTVSEQTKRIGWQIEADSYQPPGNYSGTVILVATPTY